MLSDENLARKEEEGGEGEGGGGGGGEEEREGGGGGAAAAGAEGREDSPPSLPPTDPVSLARLHLLNAYRHSWTSHHHHQPQQQQQQVVVDEYRVKWEGHEGHLAQQVARLEHEPASCDVTVATKGANIPSHRMVLAAASPFFRQVLQKIPVGQHPVVVVRDADPRLLRHVVSFCYNGLVSLTSRHDVHRLLKLADDLEITGLSVMKPEEFQATGSPKVTSPALPAASALHHQHPQQQESGTATAHSSLRPRFFRPPSSPTMFPFIGHSPPLLTSLPGGGEGASPAGGRCPKRASTPLVLHDETKKRVRVEPLPTRGGDNDPSFASPQTTPPPGSAPPHLPSQVPSPYFFRTSPPNSAPPQSVRDHPSHPSFSSSSPHHHPHLLLGPHYRTNSPNSSRDQDGSSSSAVSLVPPSRLLDSRPPHSLSSSSTPSSPKGGGDQGGGGSGGLNSPSAHSDPTHSPSSQSGGGGTGAKGSTSREPPLTPSTPLTPNTIKAESGSRGTCSTGSRVLLWKFLLDLLHNPRYSPIYIRWLDRSCGIFRIMESDMVAQLWGMARKNSNMNYEKMSRGMRTYYKRGILFHIDGTKLIYKFNISEPEIQQRMRYYDLTQKSQAEEDSAADQPGSSFLPSPSFSNLPSLPNLPTAVTTAAAVAASMENLYSPLLRDLPQSILYDPYLSSLLSRAPPHRELY